jgi:hypothetical protein
VGEADFRAIDGDTILGRCIPPGMPELCFLLKRAQAAATLAAH